MKIKINALRRAPGIAVAGSVMIADEQVHIFVTSAPRVASARVVKVPYEVNCEGHVCQEVSTAVYLGAAILDDGVATAEALLGALGMRIPANSPADAVSTK